MSRTQHQENVESFMRQAGQELPSSPTIPPLPVRRLRATLILEEAFETVKALGLAPVFKPEYDGDGKLAGVTMIELVEHGVPDLVGIVDGCCDLKVVTTGTLSACGVQDHEAQEEVDQSNLRKFQSPVCPACKYLMVWEPEGMWVCLNHSPRVTFPKEKGPHRREDGKWIKPPYWVPPDLKRVLGLP